jgi:chloramphenicol O-acetyltransferase
MDKKKLIHEFNFLPLRYIHPSWLKTIPGGRYLEGMRSFSRTEYRLSRYLLSYLGLENQYCFDFTNQVNTIALLDEKRLSEIVRYAGLVINREQIRKIIAQEDIVQLRNKMGEKAYLFALKRAPFIGTIPDFRSTEYKSENLLTSITISGVQCLVTLFSGNTAILKRLFLKFPITWESYSQLSTEDISKERNKASSLLVRIQAELEIV